MTTPSHSDPSHTPPGYGTGSPGTAFINTGKPAYHDAWGIRSYDLTNLREDLDQCTESGRAFVVWAAALVGIGATLMISWLLTINTSPLPRLWVREAFFWGGMIFLVLGIILYALDRRFTVTAAVDLAYVKRRVDSLISMFETGGPPNTGE